MHILALWLILFFQPFSCAPPERLIDNRCVLEYRMYMPMLGYRTTVNTP